MHSNTSRRTFLVPRAIHFSPYIRRTLLPLPRPNISLFSSFYTQHNTHRSQHSTFRIFNHTQARARAHTHMHTHTLNVVLLLLHTRIPVPPVGSIVLKFSLANCLNNSYLSSNRYFFFFFFFLKSRRNAIARLFITLRGKP